MRTTTQHASSVDGSGDLSIVCPTTTSLSVCSPRTPAGLRYLLKQWQLSYLLYRYRYLVCFIGIGFLSILIELIVVAVALPTSVPLPVRAVLGFVSGLVISFLLNTFVNFRVAYPHLRHTLVWFGTVSFASWLLNMAVIKLFHGWWGLHYGWLRIISSAVLFMLAYTLHRKLTFKIARNFGLAIYANTRQDVQRLYQLVGPNCDHIHIDLIDQTMTNDPAPVCLDKIVHARDLWPRRPVCMHVMSRCPSLWTEPTWDLVDWYLFHLELDPREDLMELIFSCRQRQKKVGVVFHEDQQFSALMTYLPHVDFVMVLGIRQPGRSGQTIDPRAVQHAVTLDRMRSRYAYELMFDGGVKVSNVAQIPAKYVVAASAVVDAENPIRAANLLRTEVGYAHQAA